MPTNEKIVLQLPMVLEGCMEGADKGTEESSISERVSGLEIIL
jgi:hypothetical protein